MKKEIKVLVLFFLFFNGFVKSIPEATLAISAYQKADYQGLNYTWYGNQTLKCLKIPNSLHSVHSVVLRYYAGFGIYKSPTCDIAQQHDRYWVQKVPSISGWTIAAISPYSAEQKNDVK